MKLLIDNKEYKYFDFFISKVKYLPEDDTSVYNYMNYNSYYYKYFERFSNMIAEIFKDSIKNDLRIKKKIVIRYKNLELENNNNK